MELPAPRLPSSTPLPPSSVFSPPSSVFPLPSHRPPSSVLRHLSSLFPPTVLRPQSSVLSPPSSLSHLPSPILTRRVPVPFLLSAFPISAFPPRFQLCRGRDTGRPVPPSQIPACSFPAPGSSRWHVVFAHRKVCPLGPSFLRHGLPVCASPTRRPLLQRRGLRLAAGYYEPIRLPECQTALLVVAPPFLLSPRS